MRGALRGTSHCSAAQCLTLSLLQEPRTADTGPAPGSAERAPHQEQFVPSLHSDCRREASCSAKQLLIVEVTKKV